MSGKRMTPDEVQYIRENYMRRTSRDIARTLGRRDSHIRHIAAQLGMRKGPHKRTPAKGEHLYFAPPKIARSKMLDPSIAPVVPESAKVTICPSVDCDTRYAAKDAPRVIDADECRDWARAASARR